MKEEQTGAEDGKQRTHNGENIETATGELFQPAGLEWLGVLETLLDNPCCTVSRNARLSSILAHVLAEGWNPNMTYRYCYKRSMCLYQFVIIALY